MVPGSQLRHYPAVFHVDIHLAEQGVRQQAALGVVERDSGLVTGGFQTQDQHCCHRIE